LTASTTAHIQTVYTEALCRSCQTSLFFAYDPTTDTFVGEARIEIQGGTTESVDYEPYLRVYVIDPEGLIAFDSGYVQGRLQIPTPPALQNPRSGTWTRLLPVEWCGLRCFKWTRGEPRGGTRQRRCWRVEAGASTLGR